MYTQSYKDVNPQGLLIRMKQLLARGMMHLKDTFWMTETDGISLVEYIRTTDKDLSDRKAYKQGHRQY